MKCITITLIFGLGILTACDLINTTPPPTSEEVVVALSDYALANKIFSDSFDASDDAAKDADDQLNGKKNQKTGYPIVSVSPFDLTTWPKTITLNYGTENYLCIDGRYRRGIITNVASDFYQNEGCVMSIDYVDYYQNDHKVEGDITITNLGYNAEQNLVYTVEIENGLITTPEALTISFEQSTTREWTDGASTPLLPCDDVYLVTGQQSGIGSNDVEFTMTVAEPLDVLICCKWIRDGLLDVDIEGLSTISIDYGYGTGGCDNEASIIIGDNSYPLIME